MDFIAVKSVKNEKANKSDDSIPLSLYVEAPELELTIDEFELLSLERLQLLRTIEQLKLRGFDDSQLIAKIREVSAPSYLSRINHPSWLSFFPSCSLRRNIWLEKRNFSHDYFLLNVI